MGCRAALRAARAERRGARKALLDVGSVLLCGGIEGREGGGELCDCVLWEKNRGHFDGPNVVSYLL